MADDRVAVRRGAPAARGVPVDGGENVSVYSQPGARIRNIVRRRTHNGSEALFSLPSGVRSRNP